MRFPPRLLRRRLVPVALALGAAAGACGDPAASVPAGTIETEAFVATYVDLRATALEAGGGLISDDARARVLARHEVTEEELVAFVEAHGEDVGFMRDVWDEVERRLDAQRPGGGDAPPDSTP